MLHYYYYYVIGIGIQTEDGSEFRRTSSLTWLVVFVVDEFIVAGGNLLEIDLYLVLIVVLFLIMYIISCFVE